MQTGRGGVRGMRSHTAGGAKAGIRTAAVLTLAALAAGSMAASPSPGPAVQHPAYARSQPAFAITVRKGGMMGTSVAMSGSTAVVGALAAGSHMAGQAYIFGYHGSSWHLQATLADPVDKQDDNFGSSVAIWTSATGAIAVIGAPGTANSSGFSAGAAYVYVRSGHRWRLQAQLAGTGGTLFGWSVAVDGPTAVISALFGWRSGNNGIAYVFTRSGRRWHKAAVLGPPSTEPEGGFGMAVAIAGPTAVIGDYYAPTVYRPGSAYIFAGAGSRWSRAARLSEPGVRNSNYFGLSTAITGTTVVIGAPNTDHGTGAAYVFTRSGRRWHQQATLSEPDGARGDGFGLSVAISGKRILVGAPAKGRPHCGAAYVFAPSGATWGYAAKVINPACAAHDYFGAAVALRGPRVLVGAPGTDDKTGAVYAATIPVV